MNPPKNFEIARLFYEMATLLEVHNEVFPDNPSTMEEAEKDRSPLVKRLVDYINSRELDEIMSLWTLIFTQYSGVWYNEVEELIQYADKAEAYQAD